MRRGTLITIVALFTLLAVAAVYQMIAARGDHRYPGPGPGTPYPPRPTVTASP